MIRRPSNREVKKFVKSMVKAMTRYATDHFGVDVTNTKVFFHPTVVNQPLGRGGLARDWLGRVVPAITIDANVFAQYDVRGYEEYEEFNLDPAIGGFHSTDWSAVVGALVAHEVAHAVQYTKYGYPVTKKRFDSTDTGHSEYFKEIYKVLREVFVNSVITDKTPGSPSSLFYTLNDYKKCKQTGTSVGDGYVIVGIHRDSKLVGLQKVSTGEIFTISRVDLATDHAIVI